ncbi:MULTISPECIES: MinD/ParA family protein [unclassified Fusibacter]|uniref:MinD/ParA family protein n=1 Tax=unclassified Fusibacter TaxID=2624464 RepID=UPI0010113B4B|nr:MULTISPECIES: MinD/ParA family protein [unclassified Fusibacter]MCK8058778.1 MinD/ParA family protein [Fusibacter sp. A2]NPE21852.1 MinD/ParA family protein [Fusibacter sp. A1]RXV61424.1 MinD/ParA family protein [Fusibacter sp. A1]
MKDQAQRLRELIQNTRASRNSIEKAKNTNKKNDARVIAISSGKGGVGKTNVTVNLGIALSKLGKRVTIIDADLGLANIDVVLGLVPKYNLFHMLRDGKTLEEITVFGPHDIQVISGGSGVMDLVNLADEEIAVLIDSFETLNETADYILIDTGAGINRSVMSFIEASHEVIMVVTPDPTSITDAYAVIKNIAITDKAIRVIINKAESNKEGFEVFHKLNSATHKFLNLELESLGFILDDPNVKRSVKVQKPFLVGYPNALASKGVELIAYNLDHDSHYVSSMNSFGVFIKRLFTSI